MKHLVNYCILFIVFLLTSCGKKSSELIVLDEPKEEKPREALPFTEIDLNDLSAFKPTSANWQIAGNVIADRKKEKTLIPSDGTGILLNTNDQEKNKPLFTAFEHGDIEIELDVMMPKGSNSGLYFQSRYEIQLFDSWGVEHPKYSDIGGLYQRWDNTKEKGSEGYEGNAPNINVAKAPGLWQHFKIIFHAPKFDDAGEKIKNAWFEEVWLNGVLIQQNVEVTGPTRAAAHGDEKSKDALMIQGDHGPVALKNIKYKLYENRKLRFVNLTRKEYESKSAGIENLDSLPVLEEFRTETFSLKEVTSTKDPKIVTYSGDFEVPTTGNYLFELRTAGVVRLVVNNTVIINANGGNMDDQRLKEVLLEQGKIPFELIYNQNRPWKRGFSLFLEGPGIQKYSLEDGGNKALKATDPMRGIVLKADKELIVQRSFLMHKGVKRTHCISVGTPQGIHYSYDLATGTLLQVWSGNFLNTTQMWSSRGTHQLGEPIGFVVSLQDDTEFFNLEDKDTPWPKSLADDSSFKQGGYEFDKSGVPVFFYQIGSSKISNKYAVSNADRLLNKTICVNGDSSIWHKLADGEHIEILENNVYVVNDESYYIDFSGNSNLKPIVRKVNGKDELIVKIPSGEQNINYSIIW
jgi:hypothetical protein